MTPLSQFFVSTVGGIFGILIVSLFFKHVRAHYLQFLPLAVAAGLTLPIYSATLDKWRYGIWLLPVLGGILAAASLLVGHLVAKAWAKRADRRT